MVDPCAGSMLSSHEVLTPLSPSKGKEPPSPTVAPSIAPGSARVSPAPARHAASSMHASPLTAPAESPSVRASQRLLASDTEGLKTAAPLKRSSPGLEATQKTPNGALALSRAQTAKAVLRPGMALPAFEDSQSDDKGAGLHAVKAMPEGVKRAASEATGAPAAPVGGDSSDETDSGDGETKPAGEGLSLEHQKTAPSGPGSLAVGSETMAAAFPGQDQKSVRSTLGKPLQQSMPSQACHELKGDAQLPENLTLHPKAIVAAASSTPAQALAEAAGFKTGLSTVSFPSGATVASRDSGVDAPATTSGLHVVQTEWQVLFRAGDSRPYFYCQATKATSWFKPPGLPCPSRFDPLPQGWHEMVNPDGQAYFVDTETKTTHWGRPMA